MTQLFGKGTIKSHLEVLHGFDDAKVEIIKELHKDLKNGLLIDEVKYKEKFNQIFFGDLLGYENRTHRIPEGTIPGAGSADITLGNFTDGKYELENVQVVCELKGAKTNLTKKQFGHGGLSPVGQGFAYKTGLKNCKRLIVSNFYEIRLYRDNTTDFEIWNLDELLDPKDNYFNLRKLYLLLHKDNLLTAKTEKLLSHFREEQQEITKKFYKEYKELRIELINDMRHNNPSTSIEILIEKAQKIIDRLIFIFFCEDKGLLPDKRLKESILKAGEFDFTPWEITKKFFTSVDKGSEKLGIPNGYNGGLFKEDETLNGIRIGDTICRKFINLTNYNFDDQLSVNVLGHIFEQSISDLENLKIDLLGTQTQTDQLVDTGKGRRKKDGIFYTPEYIVDYIVQNSVMKYLNEKEDECLAKYKKDETKAYQAYQQILQNIKVLDPACGSGAFLVRVFDVLFEENKRVGSILNSLFDYTEIYKNILTNNIYGVDLNEESVEITKLSLRLKSAQKGKKLNNLDANIKCGNSLIDDPAVAGDKAFNRRDEFPGILGYGIKLPMKLGQKKEVGFDVIVGNPPYTYRGSISDLEKTYFKNKYSSIEGNYDLYKIFMEKIEILLKRGGFSSFIVPNAFLSAQTYHKLRDILISKFSIEEMFDLGLGIFENVIVESIIFCIRKTDFINNQTQIKIQRNRKKPIFDLEDNYIVDIVSSQKNDGTFNIYLSKGTKTIIDKIRNKAILLKDICYCTVGINTGYIKSDMVADHKINEKYHKVLNGKNISKNSVNRAGEWIIYDSEYVKSFGDKGRSLPPEYIFTENKILVQRTRRGMKRKLVCYFDNEKYYNLNRLSNIVLVDKLNFSLKYIYALLNSELLDYYFNNFFNEYEVKPLHLGQLPIKEIPFSDQQPFIEKADKMLLLNKELHELIDKFLHRIQDNLKIEKLTKKLESFYEGEFKDFLDELKKQKIPLSLSDQDAREPYFKEYKEKILSLKGEMERTDKEIDEMVFDLYGLSKDDRKVVLGG